FTKSSIGHCHTCLCLSFYLGEGIFLSHIPCRTPFLPSLSCHQIFATIYTARRRFYSHQYFGAAGGFCRSVFFTIPTGCCLFGRSTSIRRKIGRASCRERGY